MLLLAHTSREDIPPALKKDLEFVLTKSMPLLQEMLAMSTLPRMQVGQLSGGGQRWACKQRWRREQALRALRAGHSCRLCDHAV